MFSAIGLSDQEPAMMVDNVVFTELTPEKVNDIISQLKQGKTAVEIANPNGTESKDRAYVPTACSSAVRTCS
jgi:[NiFe] hydrogenase diaphorase moiety large subunit